MKDHNLPILIAIGTSAGGPSTIVSLLKEIPKNFSGSIVIIQHFESSLAQDLIEWWRGQANIPVKLAEDGLSPQSGTVYVAGGPTHLIITEGQTFASSTETDNSHYSPSVDHFFYSVAKNWRGSAIGVLLTGMGEDGARGLLALKQKGYLTLAQSQESAAIFGMPKAAIKIGAAKEVLSLEALPNRFQIECARLHRDKMKMEKS